MTVYYNPAYPSIAVIEPSKHSSRLGDATLAVIIGAVWVVPIVLIVIWSTTKGARAGCKTQGEYR